MVPLIEIGVGLEDRDGALVVGPTLKIEGVKTTKVDLIEGDIVLTINGQNVSSGEQFSPVYDKVAGGGEITLKVKRGEKQFEVVFKKPEGHGMRMIKKSGN